MTEKKVSIDAIKKQMGMMPGVSALVMKLLQLVSDDEASIDEIEQVILMDQSIAAKIISIANSAYYGYPGTITSVKQAIVRVIGLRMVKSMALSLSLIKNFQVSDESRYVFQMSDFWVHVLSVAAMSQELVKKSKLEFEEDVAYLAGLLHDIGIVVFNKLYREQYDNVVAELKKNGDRTLVVAESDAFEFNHQLVGELLCKKWNMPDIIRDVVAFHHCPEKYKGPDETKKYVFLIHLADNLVKELNIGYCGDVEFEHNEMKVMKELQIECSEADRRKIDEKLRMAAELFESIL